MFLFLSSAYHLPFLSSSLPSSLSSHCLHFAFNIVPSSLSSPSYSPIFPLRIVSLSSSLFQLLQCFPFFTLPLASLSSVPPSSVCLHLPISFVSSSLSSSFRKFYSSSPFSPESLSRFARLLPPPSPNTSMLHLHPSSSLHPTLTLTLLSYTFSFRLFPVLSLVSILPALNFLASHLLPSFLLPPTNPHTKPACIHLFLPFLLLCLASFSLLPLLNFPCFKLTPFLLPLPT